MISAEVQNFVYLAHLKRLLLVDPVLLIHTAELRVSDHSRVQSRLVLRQTVDETLGPAHFGATFKSNTHALFVLQNVLLPLDFTHCAPVLSI